MKHQHSGRSYPIVPITLSIIAASVNAFVHVKMLPVTALGLSSTTETHQQFRDRKTKVSRE
jgi:hypothetical protein